jgi:hypothetical protein
MSDYEHVLLLKDIRDILRADTQLQSRIVAELSRIDADLRRVLSLLSPPIQATMTLTINPQGESMSDKPKAVKATLDLQLPDSGTGTASLAFVDAAGLPATLPSGTIPVWSSSNPAIVVTPAADGLSAQFGPSTPPVLATGVVITAVTTLPSGTVITATGQPIDVVGGGPTGATMVETVP